MHSIDIRNMRNILREFLNELDCYLAEEPGNYRRLMRYSRFSYGMGPDYNDRGQALLYLLKNSWQYSLEYCIMFRIALRMLREYGTISADVYSFGCGACVDAFSLDYAIKSEFPGIMNAEYTGVDAVRWPVMFPVPEEFVRHNSDALITADICDFWDGSDSFSGNILFFPKIMCELGEENDEAGSFARGLARIRLTQGRIILCVSYRNKETFTKGLSEPEWNKTQKIIDALSSQGYYCSRKYAAAPGGTEKYFCKDMVESDSGELFPYYYISGGEEDLTIKEVMPDFMPADEVIQYLDIPGDIRRHCRYYASREKKYCVAHKTADDPVRVCRSECPITCITEPQIKVSTSYRTMCFQVLEFTRYH